MHSIFMLLIIISVSNPAVVQWMPNKSLYLAINYKDHVLPCSKQAIVFPETISETMKVDKRISVSELVLPRNGEFIFEDGSINMGPDSNDNCTEVGNAYYTPRYKSSWADPDVWSSTRFNDATPDAERQPCYDDEVIFPLQSQFTIFLPQKTQYFRKLSLFGVNMNTEWLKKFLRLYGYVDNAWQEFVRNENGDTGIVIEDTQCKSVTGCPCQRNMLDIDCAAKVCQKPKCSYPIQPTGHCCKICGGFLSLDIDKIVDFNFLRFSETVAEIVDTYGKDSVVYHISRLPNNKTQVVVVDRGEFVGTSVKVVNELEYRFGLSGFKSMPLSKTHLGATIAFSMFFIVVLTMAAIYIYYYKVPKMADVRIPMLGRGQRGVITRFNRRTDSVVSLTRRDSTVTLRSNAGTAFRNPLYDSKRGRVEVVESVEE